MAGCHSSLLSLRKSCVVQGGVPSDLSQIDQHKKIRQATMNPRQPGRPGWSRLDFPSSDLFLGDSAHSHRLHSYSRANGFSEKPSLRRPCFQAEFPVHAALQAGDICLLAASKRTGKRPVMAAEEAPQSVIKHAEERPHPKLPGSGIS
jgi:hypothetical protein